MAPTRSAERIARHGLVTVAALALGACVQSPVREAGPQPVAWKAIASLPPPPADHGIAYGQEPFQFGELRLPEGAGPHPVAVVIHGGCWLADYDLRYITHLSAALARAGIATWTLEYRRIGDEGGGWPGTFEDLVQGSGHLEILAGDHALDLERVVFIGHSAGGHLALWLAARHNLPPGTPLHAPAPLEVRGIVTLAGITDLRSYGAGDGGCNAAVTPLLGGAVDEVPERYARASPIELLPLGVPQRLLVGALDPIVPLGQAERYAERARAAGDDVQLWPIEAAGHFDLVAPFARAWATVEGAVLDLLAER